MITDADITRQVITTLEASDADLAASIDVDALVGEIMATYGLVDIETIDDDAYWALVARHDATQQVEIVVSAVAEPGQEQQVISREAAVHPVDLADAELSAHDLGCEPGTLYRVAVVDSEGRELRAVEIAAR